MPSLLQLPRRIVGYLFLDDSYGKYYTSQVWDQKYQRGHSLDIAREDGRYQAVANLVRQYAGGGIILDAGCGDGLLENKCCSLGLKMVGIDYSCAAIVSARKRHLSNCEFICADARSFFSHQRFSIIVFNESLYYIKDCLESLHTMTLLLDPNGVFIISMFDTLITRRIWENLRSNFSVISEVRVKNRVSWTIRVLRSHLLSANPCGRLERSSVRKAFPPERDSHSQRTG